MPPPLYAAAPFGIAFRTMEDADYAFTEALYASTRTLELAETGWPDEAKQAFLAQQHRLQHHHYQTHYSGAEWLIVERDGEPIGRLYLQERSDEVAIVDISLIPSARGKGLGGAMLRDIIDQAAAAGKGVAIHVEKNNPARNLYQRLGFAVAEDKGGYDRMTCPAGHGASASAQ